MSNDGLLRPAQFEALATLLRLRGGAAQEVARLVMVDGLAVPEAAQAQGLGLRTAYSAVQRVREGYELARKVMQNA